MIQVESLAKEFGSVKAVQNISFSCKAGEIYGLLGANGAGKTTTIRMLSTMLKPTGGTAKVNGFDILAEESKVRQNIGVLTGEGGLYQRLTAEENIRYFGRLYDLSDDYIDSRIGEFFSLLDMEDYRKRKTDGFSKGMKQKVNIVRSIIHNPPVMLFDEPTSGLDVMSARTVLDFIGECKKQGKSIILSTHIMSEVEKLCDRIGIIANGTLVAEGTLAELLEITGEENLEEAFVKLGGMQNALAAY